jgi:hypothetical protein
MPVAVSGKGHYPDRVESGRKTPEKWNGSVRGGWGGYLTRRRSWGRHRQVRQTRVGSRRRALCGVCQAGVSGPGSGMRQQHYPLPGSWWGAIGGPRRLQCAQGPVYCVRCHTQGGHDVWDVHPGDDSQQGDLAVWAGQRGDQCGELGTVSGVDLLLAVLAGICGSGRRRLDRREDRRWRHRCPHKDSATAGTGRCTRPPTPMSGSGCRPLDPVAPWPTGVRVDQPTSARHARRNVPGQLGDIERIPARRAISDDRGGATRRITTPGRLVLGACRRALVAPRSGACATDSSRKHRVSKPVWRIKLRATRTRGVQHGTP